MNEEDVVFENEEKIFSNARIETRNAKKRFQEFTSINFRSKR